MIYLISGNNSFLIKKALKDIAQEKEKKGRLSVREIDVKKIPLSSIIGDFWGNEIFKQNKLFVLRSASSNQSFIGDFIEFFDKKELLDVSFVFLEKDPCLKESPLFEFIKKRGKIIKISIPKRNEIKKIAEEKVHKRGYLLDPKTTDLLLDNCQEDIDCVLVELEKLMAYKFKEKNIKEKDVLLLTKSRIETGIFKTIDAIAKKNKKEALRLIENHLKSGNPPLYLFKMIIFQFRNLLSVKEGEERGINKTTANNFSGMHPFVVKKSLLQAKNFTLPQLKKIYKKLFQIDLAIKKGKIAPQEGLELFILDL